MQQSSRKYLKMVEKTSNENRVTWRLPLFTVLIALIAFAVGGRDLVFPYIFVGAVISMLLLNDMIRKKRSGLVLTLVIYWAVSAVLVANVTTFRNAVRWLVWSQHYKAAVLAQPEPAKEDFKHIEFDGWGMFAQNTVVYLVFDPTDSLLRAERSHQPGKFNGIPCEVPPVHRLESHWYIVQFYTGEDWGECS